MDTNDISTHNKYAYVDYNDDGHDSDLESRLYSEIYFSNSIIGEDNVANSENSSHQINKEDFVSSNPKDINLSNKRVNQNSQNKKDNGNNLITNNTRRQQNSIKSNNTSKNTNNTVKESQIVSENIINNQKNETLNSKKRSSTNKSDESGDSTAKRTKIDLKNTIVNPYYKPVSNSPQKCMKILSPEFLNLFFGKQKNRKRTEKSEKSQSKRKENKTLEKSKSSLAVQSQNLNNTQSNDTAHKQVHENESRQVTENERERNNSSNASEIIDISSESSKDSLEDNSKYNTSLATEKKLSKRNVDNNTESDSSSTSEESIFEVPVPPKPAPPVIEVKDSDHEITDESDDDSCSNNPSNSDSEDDSEFEKSIDIALNTADDLSDSSESEDDESEESDNLILNCTGVQRGVSSIDEIKKMSHQTNSKETSKKSNSYVTHSDTHNISNDKSIQNQSNKTNIAILKNSSNIQNNKNPNETASKKTNSDENHFFRPMNDRMKSFYNDSWGGENFDMDKLRGKMSRDPNKWAILDTDMILHNSKSKRYFGVVCARCQKNGHKHTQCPLQYNNPVCHMCGVTGHFVTACPNKKCLTCGSRQPAYKKTCERCQKMYCTRCQSRGHTENTCPDLWRRYHQTTSNTVPVIPSNSRNIMKSKYDLYCCNCAKKGHDSLVCRKLRWSQHFTNPPFVINYNGPCYEDDFDTFANLNETQDSSFNLNSTCDTSFNNTLNYTTDLNSSHEKSLMHRQNSSNDLNINSKQSNGKFIFQRKSKLVDESAKLGKLSIKYDLPKPKRYCDYDDWRGLIIFFNNFLLNSPGEYYLEQNDRKLFIDLQCTRKFHTSLKRIINQYISRNNLERSYLFLEWERDGNIVTNHLQCKMAEIKNVKEDPLQLYEEFCQLTYELENQTNENIHQNTLKCNKLALCQQKLLLALYQEGFGDTSLRDLNKWKKKIDTMLIAVKSDNKKKAFKKKYIVNVNLISIKALIEYLYLYNNIFAPHEPTKISDYIQLYKEHLATRDRLRNNPLIFPVGENVTVQSNNINLESSAPVSHTTPVQSISTTISQTPQSQVANTSMSSQPPPLLSVNTSIVNNFHFTQEPPSNTNSISQGSNQYFSPIRSLILSRNASKNIDPEKCADNSRSIRKRKRKQPNGLYLQALEAKGSKKKKLENSFNHFIKNAKTLLADARTFNSLCLQKHIDVLDSKLKNEIYLYKKDLKPLTKLVNKERLKRNSK